MRGCQISLGNLGRILVSLKGLVGGLLSLVSNSKLSKITVVITLPRNLLDNDNEHDKDYLTHIL